TNPASGNKVNGENTHPIDIAAVARAMGVNFVRELDARDLESVTVTVKEAIQHDAPAVVVIKTMCVFVNSFNREPYTVTLADCNGCTLCFRIGCPAIFKSDERDEKTNRPKAWIDTAQCVGCGLCYDVCNRQAIEPGKEIIQSHSTLRVE
ncbi:MAG: hypothetical protein GY805_02035, partial [Chloroflexi bacterium]|nr:hypothetical protein [Chloroflexota bacterium]